MAGVVGKGHAFVLHQAAGLGEVDGARPLVDLRRAVQVVEDALEQSYRAGKVNMHGEELRNRHEQAVDQRHERHYLADAHAAVDRQPTAVAVDQGRRHRTEERAEHEEPASHHALGDLALHQSLGDVVEALGLLRLAAEGFDQHQTGDVQLLLDQRGHLAHRTLYAPRDLKTQVADLHGTEDEERQHDHGDQGETPVQPEHQRHRGGARDSIGHHVREARCDNLLDAVDVVGQAGGDVAGACGGVEA